MFMKSSKLIKCSFIRTAYDKDVFNHKIPFFKRKTIESNTLLLKDFFNKSNSIGVININDDSIDNSEIEKCDILLNTRFCPPLGFKKTNKIYFTVNFNEQKKRYLLKNNIQFKIDIFIFFINGTKRLKIRYTVPKKKYMKLKLMGFFDDI